MRISDWSSDVCSSDLERLGGFAADPSRRYPAPIPYAIAETVKGFGFPGAGINAAHDLPLGGNPSRDEVARHAFNEAARALFVHSGEIDRAVAAIAIQNEQNRPLESRHPDRKSTRLNSSH